MFLFQNKCVVCDILVGSKEAKNLVSTLIDVKHTVLVKSSTSVDKHLKDDKLFSCDLCNYKATQKSSLTRHKLGVHEGIRYS